ncbi:hypothetical protein G7054_g10152 [Neopestalotiopsis clavispora]|nr:hypothetical protein G7054_g10152 [Neopestalotiopsis clavispora]
MPRRRIKQEPQEESRPSPSSPSRFPSRTPPVDVNEQMAPLAALQTTKLNLFLAHTHSESAHDTPQLMELRTRNRPAYNDPQRSRSTLSSATGDTLMVNQSFANTASKVKDCNNVLAELQQLGLREFARLPNLAMVGDQSAGKSSLISGLAELDLLRSGVTNLVDWARQVVYCPQPKRGSLKNHQNKFHKEAAMKYTTFFLINSLESLKDKKDKKPFSYLKEIYKNINRRIKGCCVGRTIQQKKASAGSAQALHDVPMYPVQQHEDTDRDTCALLVPARRSAAMIFLYLRHLGIVFNTFDKVSSIISCLVDVLCNAQLINAGKLNKAILNRTT